MIIRLFYNASRHTIVFFLHRINLNRRRATELLKKVKYLNNVI